MLVLYAEGGSYTCLYLRLHHSTHMMLQLQTFLSHGKEWVKTKIMGFVENLKIHITKIVTSNFDRTMCGKGVKLVVKPKETDSSGPCDLFRGHPENVHSLL